MAILGTKKTKDTSVKKVAPKKETKTESMQDLYANKEATSKKVSASKFDGAHRVLIRPLITEKAANLGTLNKYAFVVSGKANKVEVSKAVLAVYGVRPVNVNIICVKGKVVTRGRLKGRRSDLKKAIITLKKGETIQIYEGV